MNASSNSRLKLGAAIGGVSAALAGGVLFAAVQAERGGTGSVLSDPGTVTAPSTITMTTGATTSTSPGQPSVSASIATPQITTTPTSATPG